MVDVQKQVADESVVNGVRDYLRKLQEQGLPVSFAVLYGSQATGKAHDWGDIDLIVISPRYDEPRTRDDVNGLWRLAARVDSRIEPVPYGVRQWAEDDVSTVIEMERHEGTRIDPPIAS